MNSDGTDLYWFNFKVPNQTGWAPFGFFRDGHRVLFFSMDPRRDGPGRPFDDFYHQTPTHIWVHDMDSGELTEIATKNRIAPYYGGGVLINDKRILMQVARAKNAAQIFNMNLDGSDANEFTRDGEGFPYGLNISPDGKRVAFHIATPASYQAWVSDIDGSNRVRIAADPDYCSDRKSAEIKAELTRHLAGDFTVKAVPKKKEENCGWLGWGCTEAPRADEKWDSEKLWKDEATKRMGR